ncbi:S-phase kinase-associated protein 2 [Genypterus blacodes]|uniref:S-phase kinase-associated protein 2 n=1 Tax=Genypterus blacodes TaxID=154954 RepID=UPI003F7626C7
MSKYSWPLQELPCLSLQGSVSQPKKSNKRKSRSCLVLGDGLDVESTPTELIQHDLTLHNPHTTQLVCKGKENDSNHFVLARRPRRRKEATLDFSWDHLPDELLLRILFYLPLQDLLRMSTVCRRWHRLVFDESLWHSVDLEGLTNMGPAMQQVLKTGVRRLRCPRSFIEDQYFTGTSSLQIVQLDLSSSILPTSALESIICHCRLLECLSLEGLQLSDSIIHSLSMNPNIQQLNLSGCSSFSAQSVGDMLESLHQLKQLNISWCDFSDSHVRNVVGGLSSSVTHLNLSGYRQNLTLPDVKLLALQCPNLQTLDLSDSALLTADSFPALAQLKNLHHLSLSRCYLINLAALTDFSAAFPALRQLDVFGLVNESHLTTLKTGMAHISINSRPFSNIARPTPTTCDSPVSPYHEFKMWNRRCRLRVMF